jgi:ectoine hydroxylase-related dioxygenase (phytanoyl-CoA dioxygenase family)
LWARTGGAARRDGVIEARGDAISNVILAVIGGCLRMVDGSHQLGLLPIHHLKSSSFSIGLAGNLSDFPSTPIPTEPGDAIFFGSYVIHGSGPNRSARHRRANTFAFDRVGNFGKRGDQPKGLPLSYHRCGAVDPLSR